MRLVRLDRGANTFSSTQVIAKFLAPGVPVLFLAPKISLCCMWIALLGPVASLESLSVRQLIYELLRLDRSANTFF